MSDVSFDPAGLFAPGERLPAIKSWLANTVWSRDRYAQQDPEQFLRSGEAAVCHLEELISTGAPQVWDELQADSQRSPTIKCWLGLDAQLPPTEARAAIVFDGLSLREMPLLLQMAESSGLRVNSVNLVATFHREYIPTIWQCTAQAIPRGVPVVVTSDHGYIFLGASLEANRSSDAMDMLGQARFKAFLDDDLMPNWHPDLQLLPHSRTAMLRGRLRTRPTGVSSRKLYQHGGFSLMEVLVPWIELEPR